MTKPDRDDRLIMLKRYYPSFSRDKDFHKSMADTYDCTESTIKYNYRAIEIEDKHGTRKLYPDLKLRNTIKDRDNSTCQYCGIFNPTYGLCEHVIRCEDGALLSHITWYIHVTPAI